MKKDVYWYVNRAQVFYGVGRHLGCMDIVELRHCHSRYQDNIRC